MVKAYKEDRRYELVRLLINDGKITEFRQIFDYLPKTILARDAGISLYRFTRLMYDVERFKIREQFQMADASGVDFMVLWKLIMNQRDADKRVKDQ